MILLQKFTKQCACCLEHFILKSHNQIYCCNSCRNVVHNQRKKEWKQEWREKNKEKIKKQQSDYYFKIKEECGGVLTGIKYFEKRRKEIHEERRYCERCGKDLLHVSSSFWCVHHKDENRANNVDDNFELVCKRCHSQEHLSKDYSEVH